MPPREYLNLREAASWLGLSPSTITRAKHTGALPAKKTAARGGKDLYRVSDLRAWVESLGDA